MCCLTTRDKPLGDGDARGAHSVAARANRDCWGNEGQEKEENAPRMKGGFYEHSYIVVVSMPASYDHSRPFPEPMDRINPAVAAYKTKLPRGYLRFGSKDGYEKLTRQGLLCSSNFRIID